MQGSGHADSHGSDGISFRRTLRIAVVDAAPLSTLSTRADGARWLRFIAGYGAVACASPYLALKIIWLAGGGLGVADPAVMRDTSMVALNALTAGMDIVGIALALAFTHAWGFRIPAWLLLPPIWVATGFLATFIVGLPLTVLLGSWVSESAPRLTGGPVQPWVYVIVYTEFAGLGVGLIVGFLLHARARWAETLAGSAASGPPSAAYGAQAPLANVAAVLAGALSVLYLAWAFGAAVGLSAEAAAGRTIVSTVLNGLHAVTMAGAAMGVLMMVHRIGPRAPFWLVLAITWIGSASLFSWGLWEMIVVLGRAALVRGAVRSAIVDLAALVRLITGLVIGLLMVFVLVERTPASRSSD